jgi:membrane-associated protein
MLSHSMGAWLYGLVFLIVFCETGLVVTPFLPGDSLLFALGSLMSLPDNNLNFGLLSALLLAATFLGDNVNYAIGKRIGPKVFNRKDSKIFNQKHLEKTHRFYQKHGPKAVIMARFIPIVRTFVPFIAGVGEMPFGQFLGYSLFGSILWTQAFLWAGNLFGESEFVQKNFQLVIFAVIFVSILPALIGAIRAWRAPDKG